MTHRLPLFATILLWAAALTLSAPPFGAVAALLTDQYRRALELDPDNAELRYHLGVALLNEGETAGAVAAFARAYPAKFDSVEMNYNFALAYSRLGDPDNAQIYLDLAETQGARENQTLYPTANIWYNLALAAGDKGRPDDAERFLRKSAELDPDNVEALKLLGDRLARRGDIDGALAAFRSALEVAPADATAREYLFALHYNRALALLDTPDGKPRARNELNAALAVIPANVMARYFLGYLDYQEGAYVEAAGNLIKIYPDLPADLRPNLVSMLYNAALNLLTRKEYPAGEPIAEFLVALPDPPVRDLLLAGNYKLFTEKYPEAIALYERILAQSPDNRDATFNLLIATGKYADAELAAGRQLYGEGRFRDALARFDKVLEIRSGDLPARQYREECLVELDRRATRLFDRAEETLAAGQLLEALALVHEGQTFVPGAERGKALEATLISRLKSEIETRLAAADRLVDAGAWDEAEREYTLIRRLSPDEPGCARGLERIARLRDEKFAHHLTLFDTALGGEDFTAAAGHLRELAALRPASPRLKGAEGDYAAALDRAVERQLKLGREAFAAKRVKEGKGYFNKGLALRDDPAVRKELAALELRHDSQLNNVLTQAERALEKKDFKTAGSYLAQAEQLAPAEPRVATTRAALAAAVQRTIAARLAAAAATAGKKNWRGAIGEYRQVLDLDPNNAVALQGVKDAKGQLQSELAQLAAAGNVQLKNGNLDKAEPLFRQALAIDPYYAPARDGLDRIAQSKEIGAKPGDENALYLKGIDLYTRGRYDESVKVWEKVLKLDPNHAKARENIEKARKKLEQIKEYRNG